MRPPGGLKDIKTILEAGGISYEDSLIEEICKRMEGKQARIYKIFKRGVFLLTLVLLCYSYVFLILATVSCRQVMIKVPLQSLLPVISFVGEWKARCLNFQPVLFNLLLVVQRLLKLLGGRLKDKKRLTVNLYIFLFFLKKQGTRWGFQQNV